MTKSIKLLSVLFMSLAVFMTAQATESLTVFDGDELSNTAPINNVYLDEVGTRTQVIYPAESLIDMKGEVINSMTFYLNKAFSVSGGSIKVSIGETNYANFTSTSYIEELTQVATISITEGATTIEIIFDSPYYYEGGNFVFESIVEEIASDYCFEAYLGERPTSYTTMTRGEIARFLPKTTFSYGTDAPYSSKVLPFELTFNTIRAEREDVQTVVVKNTGQNGFTPTFSTEAPFRVEQPNALILPDETLEVPVIFAPTAAGNFTGMLTIDCGEAGIHEVPLYGTAIGAAVDLTVCDSTDYASYVPIYGTDIDVVGTGGQVIYPAGMLSEMAGKKIVALQFHMKDLMQMSGGVIQLSLKEVNDTAFATAAPMTELTPVATLSPVYNSDEMIFYFNTPFEYQGGNLLVECSVIQAGTTNYRPTYFYGTPTEYDCGLCTSYWAGSLVHDLVPFLPLATFSYEKDGGVPSFIRGDVNQDSNVNINDVTALINILLSGTVAPDEADCNLDTIVNISDVTTLINFLLSGTWPN